MNRELLIAAVAVALAVAAVIVSWATGSLTWTLLTFVPAVLLVARMFWMDRR